MNTIYLDNAASTPIHPKVYDAMLPFLKEHYGNPSSIHRSGRIAKKAIQNARKQIALLINAHPSEIFFTSGGTESNNLALYGFVNNYSHSTHSCNIITSSIEHDAVLEPCRNLHDTQMAHVHYLSVDKYGTVDIDELKKLLSAYDLQHNDQSDLLQSKPTLVSIMYANNEVGSVQPIHKIVQMCHDAGAIFHTDAVQAVGKMPIDVREIQVDMMSISSHKIHGPKGIGALYVRDGIKLMPKMLGGGQERGVRSGTENVMGIVGFGTACNIARQKMNDNVICIKKLRDTLISKILDNIPNSVLNGPLNTRLFGNVHFTFLGVNGEDLLVKLDEHGIAASTGSACTMNKQKESHVLKAMGFTHEQIAGSLRLSFGEFNTLDDVDYTVDTLKKIVHELRMVSPFKSKYEFN